MRWTLCGIVLVLVAAGCATDKNCQKQAEQPKQVQKECPALEAAVSAFILEGLQSPHALRAKFYLDASGRVVKSAAYVSKKAVPEWLHTLADEKIGKGEGTEFELEQYENGDQVYEVTRKVDGKEVELSVKTDKTLKYIERPMDPDALPEAIKAAVAGQAGFLADSAAHKEGPGLLHYTLRGKKGGEPWHLILDGEGKLIGSYRILEARIEVAR